MKESLYRSFASAWLVCFDGDTGEAGGTGDGAGYNGAGDGGAGESGAGELRASDGSTEAGIGCGDGGVKKTFTQEEVN